MNLLYVKIAFHKVEDGVDQFTGILQEINGIRKYMFTGTESSFSSFKGFRNNEFTSSQMHYWASQQRSNGYIRIHQVTLEDNFPELLDNMSKELLFQTLKNG